MRFDESEMSVERQVLRHCRVGIKPERRQAKALGLVYGVVD